MSRVALVDTGPLTAAVDVGDVDHAACVAALARRELSLVVPALAVAEAACLIGKRLGPAIEAGFLRSLESLDVEAPAPEDFVRMGELVAQYADFPLGGTDASLVALAERLGATTLITLDRRHFSAVRPSHCEHFELLP